METTTTTLPLATGTWTIDQAHSNVNFSVRHLGLAKVRGHFAEFAGSVIIGDTLDDVRIDADIAMGSVVTGNADRDAHLRSSDFFDAEAAPTMTFRSVGVTGGPAEYILDGDLTIAGTTKRISMPVEFLGSEVYPMDQSTRAGFSASTAISRSDFGIDFDIPLGADKLAIGDKVAIELDIQVVATDI